MMLSVQGKLNTETMAQMQEHMNAIYKKHGISKSGFFRMFGSVFITAPMFMTFFFALRDCAALGQSITSGGALWFPNLLIPDPFIGLPILSATSMILNMRYGTDIAADPSKKTMFYIMNAMAIGSIFVTKSFPAAVCFYWACSNIVSIGTGLMLRRPAFRKFFNIPEAYKAPNNQGKIVNRPAYAPKKFMEMTLPSDPKTTAAAKSAAPLPITPIQRYSHRAKPGAPAENTQPTTTQQ